jgi:serine/threonine protein kinase
MQNLIGQTLDGKYLIERELGRGGMGTVYFSTHIGTERPVAVKVISPQFMARTEFVERFRREARAAGRLRHPNVVDVTDFGIAETPLGRVAYLVMEYLDGCTLGEILEEEKQIPLSWTLDILEQVCSAVTEAHEQGIIHRDLKPDNIWLEPNQRGGYTVKVLDFGIAKLEESFNEHHVFSNLSPSGAPGTAFFQPQQTAADIEQTGTGIMPANSTIAGENATLALSSETEAKTMLQNAPPEPVDDSEAGTAILPRAQTGTVAMEEDGTQLMTQNADSVRPPAQTKVAGPELTRVGSVLGTPLYMSPEQCRGEKLGPRSDIYSLGVISYQMLSGDTPFSGDYSQVMKAHKETEPPPLQAAKIPRKVKKTVMAALSKDSEQRPETAEAFASILRSHSEGMGALLKRAISIYGEYLPKFFIFSLLIGLPYLFVTIVKVGIQFLGLFNIIDPGFSAAAAITLSILTFFVQVFFGAMVVGTTTWIVAHILAVPLRPFSVRAAVGAVKKRWKPLIAAVTLNTLMVSVGIILCFLPGIWLTTRNVLVAPAIIMENVSWWQAFRRSKTLVARSYWTVFGTVLVLHVVPIMLATVMSLSIASLVRNGVDTYEKIQASKAKAEKAAADGKADINVSFDGKNLSVEDRAAQTDSTNTDQSNPEEKSKLQKTAGELSQGIFELMWVPVVIFVTSFISVITALIYFKTRLAGGESMQDLLEQFEETDRPRSKWQERVRLRLVQSGRSVSKSGSRSGSRSASKT